MSPSLPSAILISVVRYRFYTLVDWSRCVDLEPDVLVRELRDVIQRLIDRDAVELPADAKLHLTNEIIQEVTELGYDALMDLRSRLNPNVPLSTRVNSFMKNTLLKAGR